jgi:parallel beta-helix repeat protein
VNANGSTIANNTTASNAEDGILLLQASGNLIQENAVYSNARYGICEFLSAGQSNTLDGKHAYGNFIKDIYP